MYLKGSTKPVVRDVTDISHATTVATLDIPAAYPQFVGPSAIAWTWGDAYTNLLRTDIATGTNVLVANCAGLFDWTRDGTTAAYASWDGEHSLLRQVTAGLDRALANLAAFPVTGCESLSCADTFQFEVAYSPDGRYILVAESPVHPLQIYSASGSLIYTSGAHAAATMAVWSGNDLYFRDTQGVEVWHSGTRTVSLVLRDVSWIDPKASPAGGQILYTVRDSSELPHVKILDTASGAIREVASGGDEPAFLTSRYVWYVGIRPCGSTDSCPLAPVIPTGTTYIYDLQTGARSTSIITQVADTWPHGA